MAMHSIPAEDEIWLWYRISFPGRVLFSAFLAHFFLCFTKSDWLRKRFVYLIYTPGVIFLAYGLSSGSLGAEGFKRGNGYWSEYFSGSDPVNNLYYLWHIILLAIIFGLIVRWRHSSEDESEKKQATLVLYSGIPAVLLGAGTNIVLPLRGVQLPNLLVEVGVIWIIGVWYAVYRYGFLEVTPATAPAFVLSSLQEAVILTDVRGDISWINRTAESLTGYDLGELKGRKADGLLLDGFLKQEKSENETGPQEAVISRRTGGGVPVFVGKSAIKKGARTIGFAYTIRDITDRKKVEYDLRKREKENRAIVEAIPDAVFRLDREGNFLDVKISDEVRLGGAAWKNITEVIPPEKVASMLEKIKESISTGRLQTLEYDMETPGGKQAFEARILAAEGNEVICFIRNITERRSAEIKLRRLTFHDPLTGLYNRTFIDEEMERLDTKRQLPISFIICDVDGLKKMNDSEGHQAGDEMIMKSAEVIKESCRNEDIIARWGGDEFIIMMPQTGRSEAEKVAERLKAGCEGRFIRNHPLSVSAGAASKDNENEDILLAIKKADELMYEDKQRKKRAFS